MLKLSTFLLCACLLAALAGCALTPPGSAASRARSRSLDLIEQGQSLEAQGQLEPAIQRYLQARDLYASPQVHYRLGHAYAQLDELETARQYLRKATEMSPENSVAFFELIHVEERLREGSAASTAPPAETAFVPPPLAEAPAHGQVQAQRPIPEASAPAPPAPAAQDPVETMAQASADDEIRLSDVYRTLFGSQGAADDDNVPLGDAGATFLADAEFHAAKAREYAAVGKTTLAVDEFGEAIMRAPGEAAYRVELARVYQQQGEPRKAQEELLKALQVNPRSAEALFYLSEMDFNGGSDQAQALLQQAAAIGAQDPETQILLGDLYMKVERQEKALEHYQRARQLQPNSPEPLWKIGNLRRSQGDAAQARFFYAEALKLDPRFIPALNNLAFMADSDGQYDQARQYLEAILRADPSWAKAYYNLGVLHEQRFADPAKAIEYYEKYLEIGGPLEEQAKANIAALRMAAVE